MHKKDLLLGIDGNVDCQRTRSNTRSIHSKPSPTELCTKAHELGWSIEEQDDLRAIYGTAFQLDR